MGTLNYTLLLVSSPAESGGLWTVRSNTFYIWPTNKATLEKAQANMPDDVILGELNLVKKDNTDTRDTEKRY